MSDMTERDLLVANLSARFRIPSTAVRLILEAHDAYRDSSELVHTGGGYYEYADGRPVVDGNGQRARGEAAARAAAVAHLAA